MMIQAIDRESIKRICSGQVVVDLATAVKEMVENSLDSGATSVEIKVKEMGSESIEVSDNGSGIDPSNYSTIALKHHTSKLYDFNDLNSVSSFGFRGEALNALCELSGAFTVTTKLASEPVGTRLNFNKDGTVGSEIQVARSAGTTVVVSNLFEVLPVRRGEFVRSIKKQYQKMVKVLQSYAIIAVGIRIVLTNISKGSKQIVIGTQAGNRMSENISTIYGSNFLLSLMPMSFTINAVNEVDEDDDVTVVEVIPKEVEVIHDALAGVEKVTGTEEEKEKKVENELRESQPPSTEQEISTNTNTNITNMNQCSITGYISKAGLGVGRSDNDRQFVFCNGRPVDLPKFTKILNEVWRRFEMKHKPACVLDIRVPAGSFDVNLTPDKREIVLMHEAALMDKLRETIDALYSPSRQTFHLSQGVGIQQALFDFSFSQSSSSSSSSSSSAPTQLELKNGEVENEEGNEGGEGEEEERVGKLEKSKAEKRKYVIAEDSVADTSADIEREDQNRNKRRNEKERDNSNNETSSPPRSVTWLTAAESLKSNNRQNNPQNDPRNTTHNTPNSQLKRVYDEEVDEKEIEVIVIDGDRSRVPMAGRGGGKENIMTSNNTPRDNNDINNSINIEKNYNRNKDNKDNKDNNYTTQQVQEQQKLPENNVEVESQVQLEVEVEEVTRPPSIWHFDPIQTVEDYKTRNNVIQNNDNNGNNVNNCSDDNDGRKSSISNSQKGSITDYTDSVSNINGNDGISDVSAFVDQSTTEAERRLSRVLSKNDFSQMRIIGQFNLGFIIAELRDDLYILDQHACDEKYRFETLQKTTVIHQQPLIIPQYIEASAAEEIIIMENITIFESNGFRIKIDDVAPPGRKIQLLAVPFSKHIQFNEGDVHELASLIGESMNAEGGSYMSNLMLKNDQISYISGSGEGRKKNTSNHSDNSSQEEYSPESSSQKERKEHSQPSIRIPKLVSMFASRACRSAIMIGTAMKPLEMKAVVGKLEGIEQPWNCPHGRPTMRHLIDLQTVHKKIKKNHTCIDTSRLFV